jgi:hypothetical protein
MKFPSAPLCRFLCDSFEDECELMNWLEDAFNTRRKDVTDSIELFPQNRRVHFHGGKSLAISQISSGRDHGWIDVFLVFRNNGLAVGAMIQMIALVVRQRH